MAKKSKTLTAFKQGYQHGAARGRIAGERAGLATRKAIGQAIKSPKKLAVAGGAVLGAVVLWKVLTGGDR